ncbi:hypothetical protein N7481_006988 [Penicillium waksmanii]|uniref:uncharacterized protein n=1 Tax=Penicillium waksmanii TaxID=69791 RepID=UPI002547B0F3|nr:uncharacterized protein N7481_006988 [Penicillium waksmanii]KAJ5979690.1 hypothetical protein N7481_006988 [Penicillium waksmanii]
MAPSIELKSYCSLFDPNQTRTKLPQMHSGLLFWPHQSFIDPEDKQAVKLRGKIIPVRDVCHVISTGWKRWKFNNIDPIAIAD